MKNNIEILQKIIDNCEKLYSINICVRDMIGVTFLIPELRVSLKNKNHSHDRCQAARNTSSGAESCIRNEYKCIEKCHRLKQGFSGFCPMGVFEYVQPVYYKNELICVIYAGSHSRLISGELMVQMEEGISLIYNIVLLILGKYENIIAECKKTSSNWIVNTITEYIICNYKNEITLASIAQLYHLNYNYLSKLFKKETGLNFVDYVTKLKIEEAKRMLIFTEKPITDITFELGYNDTAYFSRVFKKYTGYAPSVYKMNYGLLT